MTTQAVQTVAPDTGIIQFINLTSHPIHLVGDNGAVLTFATSGTIARVNIIRTNKQLRTQIAAGIFVEMTVQEVEHAELLNLPEPTEGVIYLVSSYVAQYTKRPDVMCPNTDNTCVKDGIGRVTGVKSFQQYI
jgi:hypothetical protein